MRRAAVKADPVNYVTASISRTSYAVIVQGLPICADKSTLQEALAAARQMRVELPAVYWDADAGEFRPMDALQPAPVALQSVDVLIRFDKECQRPILFFVNSNARGYWIECYDRIGQHSDAARAYMLQCKPMPVLSQAARDLLREWEQLGEPVSARPVARLSYPRALPYIGK